MGNYDGTVAQLQIGGSLPGSPAGDGGASAATIISEFNQLQNWSLNKESTYNAGPGGKVYGYNTQHLNDQVEFDIEVQQTSDNISYLYDLTDEQTTVGPILVLIPSEYHGMLAEGQIYAIGCEQGKVMQGNMNMGQQDAGGVTFHVRGNGALKLTYSPSA